jgi:hypothetical protein
MKRDPKQWTIQIQDEKKQEGFTAKELDLIDSICSPLYREMIAYSEGKQINTLKVTQEEYDRTVKKMVNHGENYSGTYESRIKGLDIMYPLCEGKTVVDMGSSNGNIAYQFCCRGAKKLHGYEKDTTKVAFTNKLFASFPTETRFMGAHLLNKNGKELFAKSLDPEYDIVLYMGVHHCLMKGNQKGPLRRAIQKTIATGVDHTEKVMPHKKLICYPIVDLLIRKAKTYFCYRSYAHTPGLSKHLEGYGFRLISASFIPGVGREYTKIWKRYDV